MTIIASHEYQYVAWQNRATEFYIAGRHLHGSGLYRSAAYCSVMAVELLLKATLVYWDRSFDPEAVGHAVAKMVRVVRNKVPGAKAFSVPEYFYFQERYLTVSRYPKAGKGLVIPSSLVTDLDAVVAQLIMAVPFQHNTELKHVLAGRSRSKLLILRKGNAQLRILRKYLKVSLK